MFTLIVCLVQLPLGLSEIDEIKLSLYCFKYRDTRWKMMVEIKESRKKSFNIGSRVV